MIWHLIESGSHTGRFNMKFDIELAKSCRENEAFFRIYRWDPYCISLGSNQAFEDINIHKAKSDGLEVVKRPTGGRAILHAEEVTYSVVMSLSCGLSPKQIYTKISQALLKGLAEYDSRLTSAELENIQPNFPDLLKQPSGVLCFASTAKSEVKFDSKKIIGSAQRKFNNVVLQHGSILCGTFHQKLAEYLNKDEISIHLLKEELTNSTTEISTILNAEVDYEKLSSSLINGFKKEFEIQFDDKKPEYDFTAFELN